jgi:hypothetical protein
MFHPAYELQRQGVFAFWPVMQPVLSVPLQVAHALIEVQPVSAVQL